MNAINTFDRIAPFYDALQRLVFGDALVESQLAFLGLIGRESKVLIIGGGTGQVLEAILRLDRGCQVWYVEASSAMIARTQERIGTSSSNVKFIHGLESSIPDNLVFDVAITGFFLDLFSEAEVAAVARRISRHLRPDGLWLITDFVNGGKWWQKLLLWSMYRFFILSCGIQARTLPGWELQVRGAGFRETASRLYFGDFIKSSVWVKFPAENYI